MDTTFNDISSPYGNKHLAITLFITSSKLTRFVILNQSRFEFFEIAFRYKQQTKRQYQFHLNKQHYNKYWN